jgi:hypothetical protein
MMQIDDRLDELIANCASTSAPDYMQFYLEADELLSSGVGPRSCCMSLAAKLKDSVTVINDFSKASPGLAPSDVDQATKRRLLVAFNGFKLLQGFIGYLPAEMRELIATHANVPTMSRDSPDTR